MSELKAVEIRKLSIGSQQAYNEFDLHRMLLSNTKITNNKSEPINSIGPPRQF